MQHKQRNSFVTDDRHCPAVRSSHGEPTMFVETPQIWIGNDRFVFRVVERRGKEMSTTEGDGSTWQIQQTNSFHSMGLGRGIIFGATTKAGWGEFVTVWFAFKSQAEWQIWVAPYTLHLESSILKTEMWNVSMPPALQPIWYSDHIAIQHSCSRCIDGPWVRNTYI